MRERERGGGEGRLVSACRGVGEECEELWKKGGRDEEKRRGRARAARQSGGKGKVLSSQSRATRERQGNAPSRVPSRFLSITLCHATSTSLWPQVYRRPLLFNRVPALLFVLASSLPLCRVHLPSFHLSRDLLIGALPSTGGSHARSQPLGFCSSE